VTYLPVNNLGLISLEELEKAIQPDTALVTIMFVNNEIGVRQPIRQIGEIFIILTITSHQSHKFK
jgi:cysteine desulfurase